MSATTVESKATGKHTDAVIDLLDHHGFFPPGSGTDGGGDDAERIADIGRARTWIAAKPDHQAAYLRTRLALYADKYGVPSDRRL